MTVNVIIIVFLCWCVIIGSVWLLWLFMFYILRSFFLSGTIHVYSQYNLIIILDLANYPFLFSLDLSRLYFTSQIFMTRRYVLTYLLFLLKFERLVLLFFTSYEINNQVLLGTIYWSPVYHYCTELLSSFLVSYRYYNNFGLVIRFLIPWFISILLFSIAFLLSLRFEVFALHELMFIRWMFLFLLVFLSLLLFFPAARSYDNNVVFVVRVIYFIGSFLLDLLEAIPMVVVRFCSLFVNSIVLIYFFFAVLYYRLLFCCVFYLYNIYFIMGSFC